jgi:hypothetical protein
LGAETPLLAHDLAEWPSWFRRPPKSELLGPRDFRLRKIRSDSAEPRWLIEYYADDLLTPLGRPPARPRDQGRLKREARILRSDFDFGHRFEIEPFLFGARLRVHGSRVDYGFTHGRYSPLDTVSQVLRKSCLLVKAIWLEQNFILAVMNYVAGEMLQCDAQTVHVKGVQRQIAVHALRARQ